MEVLIDVTRLLYRRWAGRLATGIDRVAIEYVRHYRDRARAMLVAGPRTAVLSAQDSADAFDVVLGKSGSGAAARLFVTAFLRGWPERIDAPILRVSHTGLEKTSHVEALRAHGARLVMFVHDLIPLTHPQYCRPGLGDEQAARLRAGLAMARGVIANSHDTLQKLRRWAHDGGVRVPEAVVAHLASSLPALDPGPRPIAGPYFVVLGTIEARKNHAMLLRAWMQLGVDAPRLIVVGTRGWGADEAVGLLGSPKVEERSRCSDDELMALLAHAQALLYPSFAEGYGIPVAEALALGCPVIASDLPALREAGGDVPVYLDPADEAAWRTAVMDYATTSTRRLAQLERLRGYRAPTWAQHFETVDRFLQGVT